ncbi:hypothetical protein NM688_g8724 [Phlebia brevispora]|uniref:Uncharacterized protein n=1 Tax=Phlebia brevispora TaxID=194682 RepID=A0ACC1RS66_9APHY|nr:hypothetical protein NM688_g8724 [Phlebia brevispora]
MLTKSRVALFALLVLSTSDSVSARIRWLERDGRSVELYPRRFGQEHPAVIDKLASACPGQVCGTLSGQAITPLLAAQGECTQQDMADSIIANLIILQDFTTNPPTNRNSVFCQKAPRHAELNGLVQAQDPANDPNIFFDPATSKSVTKGSQPDTFPFGTPESASSNSSSVATPSATPASSVVSVSSAVVTAASAGNTLVATSAAASNDDCVVTVTVTANAGASATSAVSSVTSSASGAGATAVASSAAIGNFGSCSVPQIEFGAGFDGRKETSFQPANKTSYNHGSAQAIDIISQFICDTLTNSCGADQTAKDTCAKASTAADAQPAKTGAQADAFNAVFGIVTDFASVAEIDDQGNIVSAGTTSATTSQAAGATLVASSSAVVASTSPAAPTASSATAGVGNFGRCSVPQIEFGAGFDGRKETSFQPVDKSKYQQDS